VPESRRNETRRRVGHHVLVPMAPRWDDDKANWVVAPAPPVLVLMLPAPAALEAAAEELLKSSLDSLSEVSSDSSL
jgi:hypothetical protein